MKSKREGSLAKRVFHATLLGCIILGIAALLSGAISYYVIFSRQMKEMAVNTAEQAYQTVTRDADPSVLTDEIMKIYRQTSPSERTGAEYWAKFDKVTNRAVYQLLCSRLDKFLEYGDVAAAYIGMVDDEGDNLVYLINPDADETYGIGRWEPIPAEQIDALLQWDEESIPCLVSRTKEWGRICISAVPIYNSKNAVSAYMLVYISFNDVIKGLRQYLIWASLALLFLTTVIAVYLAWRMKRTVVLPINAIAQAAGDYVEDRRAGKTDKDHFTELEIHTGDEVENLQKVMAGMEQDLKEIENNLTAVTAENERIGTELDLARRIQADMLPNIFPPFPERKDMEIFARMDPAKEVGGDFFDFFLLDQDHLGLVMADVSGKGVPAALFMMISKILVQNYSMTGCSPKEVLEKVNQQICQNNREEMFITVWLGILDLKNGHLTCSNAGHEYPILMQPNSIFEVVKDRHGLVIGGMDGVRYSNYELQMDPGAKLFIYTDGVPEATNAEGSLFGMDRLVSALNEVRTGKPWEILRDVRAQVDTFVGEAPQFDDITMLCLEYLGPQHLVREITKPARVESIPAVTEFINAELEALDCPMKTQMQIELAIDELFSNIAHYAYGGGKGEATVRFEQLDDPHTVQLTFIDSGIAYNPLEAPEPDVTLPAEERQAGGLGVFIVRKTMDEVIYEHVNGRNILRIKKSW